MSSGSFPFLDFGATVGSSGNSFSVGCGAELEVALCWIGSVEGRSLSALSAKSCGLLGVSEVGEAISKISCSD